MESVRFPAPGSALAERVSLGRVALVAHNLDKLPSLSQLRRQARERIAENPAIRRVESFHLLPNDDLVLVSVGPRGGWNVVHNFGNVGAVRSALA